MTKGARSSSGPGPGDSPALVKGRSGCLPVQPGRSHRGTPGGEAATSQDPGPAEPARPWQDSAEKIPGVRYNVASYRKAIQSACRKAGVANWHPHQLRHTAATEIRKRFGLEATRIILGHEDMHPDLRRGGSGPGGRGHASDRLTQPGSR